MLAFGILFLAGCGELPVAEGLKRAQADLDAGRASQAIDRLELMVKKHPTDASVQEALAFAHLNAGDPARAGVIFNELGLAKNSDDLLYAALGFKKANLTDKAVDAYRLYLLGEPKQPSPWNDLGELLVSTGKIPEGLSALVKAHELASSPELAARIGMLYDQNGNAIQAQRFLQNALKQARAKRALGASPSQLEGDALAQLADLALRDKRPSEAERHIKQLERDFPTHARLAELKAKYPAADSRADDKKRESWIVLTHKRPTTGAAKNETVKASISENKETSPKQITAVASNEASAALPVSSETTLVPVVAKDPLVDALGLDNKNPWRWSALGAAKARAGDYAWAEAAYLEAMRLKPADGPTILAYLDVVGHRRSPFEYVNEAERQLEKYPEIPELYVVTARGYRDRLQNKRNASILFKRFLDKFPNHPEVPQIKVELAGLK